MRWCGVWKNGWNANKYTTWIECESLCACDSDFILLYVDGSSYVRMYCVDANWNRAASAWRPLYVLVECHKRTVDLSASRLSPSLSLWEFFFFLGCCWLADIRRRFEMTNIIFRWYVYAWDTLWIVEHHKCNLMFQVVVARVPPITETYKIRRMLCVECQK